MNKEQATAIKAALEASPDALAEACAQYAPEGTEPKAFMSEIIEMLGDAAGSEEEVEEENA